MTVRLCLASLLMLSPVSSLNAGPPAADVTALYAAFQAPPPAAHPFVRWWWNGGRVREAELLRQLDLLAAAGIGGVEINTIGMPVVAPDAPELAANPEITWLSPQWCRLVAVVADAAKARGLQTDLLVGSGWPLGGKFLRVDQQTQRIRLARIRVHGPQKIRVTPEELLAQAANQPEKTADEVTPARSELHFVRLLPIGATQRDFNPGTTVALRAAGPIKIDVPAGEHELALGVREWGFTHVKLGAPGADGPVVDHFSAAAVRAYLDHMAANLSPALGGKLGHALRALFVDSVELDYANWTDDVPAQFRSRRGYDLEPYLPHVLAPDDPGLNSGFATAVRQARSDFNRTLVELFQERFIDTYVAFCREQNVLARMQAYGRETDPIEGALRVDLPEGETWLWRGHGNRPVAIESTAVNKFVSSAAHLRGIPLVSFEAMSNPVVPFQETLADFKVAVDLSFLDGLNHPILHGFNYSPPEAGFPGWVRFGSYLSERNPWWSLLPGFTAYAARVGTVLRNSTPRAEIAILAPRVDEWGRFGRLYQPFPEVRHPWYIYELGRAIQQAGNGADYVTETVLQQATCRDGGLAYGPQHYRAVILAEVPALAAATLRALQRFAEAGGSIIVLGALPEAEPTPGSRPAAPPPRLAGRRQVHVAAPPPYLEPLPDAAPPSHQPAGNGRPGPQKSYAALVPWARGLLDRAGLAPVISFAPASAELSQAHHALPDAELYFIANRSHDRPVATNVTLTGPAGLVWRWDPETGAREPLGSSAASLPLHLQPEGSVILVLDRTTPAPSVPAPAGVPGPAPVVRAVKEAWSVELWSPGARVAERLPAGPLTDLGQGATTSAFGGVAHYRANLDIDDPARITTLDLGIVHGASEVTLNGRPLGARWHGRHDYPVGQVLRPGRNELVVTVRTPLANYARSLRGNAAAQRWTSWYDPTPCGLIGPVVLRGGR